MKTSFLLFLLLTAKTLYAQDPIIKVPRYQQNSFSKEKYTHVFSVSPMSRKTATVDGLVLGFGHIDNKVVEKQTINGLNIEVNPAPVVGGMLALVVFMHLPEAISNIGKKRNHEIDTCLIREDRMLIKNFDKTPLLKMNGINISSGCFFTATDMNGLNISFANKFRNFNGLSVAPLGTMADKQTGISLGLINANNDLNGLVVGAYNQSLKLDGLQLGLVNIAGKNDGLQVGVFNKSRSKGFQIGVWNKNAKRSLPLLNW